MKQKLDYLFASLKRQFSDERFRCPSCGSAASSVADRKFLVTSLRRCGQCRLMFRAPTAPPQENEAFYQQDYVQGYTTDMPSGEQLAAWLDKAFAGTERDYSAYIAVVRAAAGAGAWRVFDFGCSWGYGSWQFGRSGFEVEAFEISRPRAEFARDKLGVKAHSTLPRAPASFDVVFSSHVLEHVSSVGDAIHSCMELLKPGGLFVAVTPNGSAGFRRAAPEAWHKLWGLVHPNFLDAEFYQSFFPGGGFFMASNPFPLREVEAWAARPQARCIAGKLDGDELLFMVRKER